MKSLQTIANKHIYIKGDNKQIELIILMSLLSSFLLSKHYNDVILYADNISAEIFKNTYYTDIRVIPENVFGRYDATLSKFYAYSDMDTEYIHFDIDYFLFNSNHIQFDEILFAWPESTENIGEIQFQSAYLNVSKGLNTIYKNYPIIQTSFGTNLSVFGVSDKVIKSVSNHFKNILKTTNENIHKIGLLTNAPNPAIEQFIATQFMFEKKYKINWLKKFEQRINWEVDNLNKFEEYHLWKDKHREDINELLLNQIKNLYPELLTKYYIVLENYNKNIVGNIKNFSYIRVL
jgi:hypothetical protein